MDALRASVAHLSARPEEDPFLEAVSVVGATAVFAATWARQGTPVRPDPKASHAADDLRMATGRDATPAAAAALDAYFVTVVVHGMNASTFAARVVASTASDVVPAVVAAIGALKGKLHGGAPGPVLDMLDAIQNVEGAAAWLEAALGRGERLMGMGHRVYRVHAAASDGTLQPRERRSGARSTSSPPRVGSGLCRPTRSRASRGHRHEHVHEAVHRRDQDARCVRPHRTRHLLALLARGCPREATSASSTARRAADMRTPERRMRSSMSASSARASGIKCSRGSRAASRVRRPRARRRRPSGT